MDDFKVSAVNAPSDHYVDIYDQGVKINDQPVPVVDGVWRFAHTYSGGRHVLTAKAANAASAEYVFDVRDEVHEDFSGVYREVLIGQEYIVLEELKHFWLKDTRETGYFGVIFSPAYSHTGLSIYGPQGGEVKFCTGWKRVEMRFIMSSTSPALPIDSGIVTFYDLDRRILGTRQTGILGIGEEESLEYMAPEGSVIGYAILGCGGSGESQVTVNDMRMSR